MAERPDIEQTLLAEIRRRTVQMSEAQHEMARQQRILVHAATQLRMGRSAAPVLAEIREQSPELLRDWCDIHLTITAGPVRPVPRVAASA
jgi:hypothetical protein